MVCSVLMVWLVLVGCLVCFEILFEVFSYIFLPGPLRPFDLPVVSGAVVVGGM